MKTLKLYRKSRNITQSELARMIDVSRFSVIAWEAGKAIPNPKNRKQIEKITGPIQWIPKGKVKIKAADPCDIAKKLQDLLVMIQMLEPKHKTIFRTVFLGMARTL